MLVSPPEKLLQAGIKVKQAQLNTSKISPVMILGAVALGIVGYMWYRNRVVIHHAVVDEDVLSPPAPIENVLQKWQTAFSTG